jgi:hypothetical protein
MPGDGDIIFAILSETRQGSGRVRKMQPVRLVPPRPADFPVRPRHQAVRVDERTYRGLPMQAGAK